MSRHLISRAEVEVGELENKKVSARERPTGVLLDRWADRENWLNVIGGGWEPNKVVAEHCIRHFDLPLHSNEQAQEFDPFFITRHLPPPISST